MRVIDQLHIVALERGLRPSTVVSYETLLRRVGVLDQEVAQVSREAVLEALWSIDSPNTRRSTVVALRAVLGLDIKIPKAVPKRYDLPSEDTLRLALMTSPHEARGLLMLYGGLRIGEACGVTGNDLSADRLRVDKQVVEIHRTGKPTTNVLGPVKSFEATVTLPFWLVPQVQALDCYEKPSAVRESLRRGGQRVGIHLNPHMLRHACATLLLAKGVPLITVSRHLRHSDPSTTLRTYAQANDAIEIHDAFG